MKKLNPIIRTETNTNQMSRKMYRKDKFMKRNIKIMIIATMILVAGCSKVKRAPENNDLSIVGSGNLVRQEREVSGFDHIDAGLIFDLTIRQGDEFGVVLVADDNWVDFLSTDVEGNTLVLDYIDGYAYNVSNVTMRVEVTLPELAGLSLGGSAHAWLGDFRDEKSLVVTLNGSSYLNGAITADQFNLQVNGSSLVQLSGSGHSLFLDICGSSLVDLSGFEAEEAEIDLACSDLTIVQVRGRLNVHAAQNSKLYYIGEPEQRMIDVYGSASVLPYKE
jgi:hypothetical protein